MPQANAQIDNDTDAHLKSVEAKQAATALVKLEKLFLPANGNSYSSDLLIDQLQGRKGNSYDGKTSMQGVMMDLLLYANNQTHQHYWGKDASVSFVDQIPKDMRPYFGVSKHASNEDKFDSMLGAGRIDSGFCRRILNPQHDLAYETVLDLKKSGELDETDIRIIEISMASRASDFVLHHDDAHVAADAALKEIAVTNPDLIELFVDTRKKLLGANRFLKMIGTEGYSYFQSNKSQEDKQVLDSASPELKEFCVNKSEKLEPAAIDTYPWLRLQCINNNR